MSNLLLLDFAKVCQISLSNINIKNAIHRVLIVHLINKQSMLKFFFHVGLMLKSESTWLLKMRVSIVTSHIDIVFTSHIDLLPKAGRAQKQKLTKSHLG